ncbi:MAG: hypothetical protein ACYTAO_11720 [Planctomycetota bacterium]
MPIGTIEQYWTGAAPECEIPVGDYTSHIMDVTYDNLSIEISNNYHTNAQGLRSGTDVVYGMKVRKDKPYVLDFSNEPMVVFDQPPTSQTTFSRGDEIAFAAVLVDPKLDISGGRARRRRGRRRGRHALWLSRHLRVHVACTGRSGTQRRPGRADRNRDLRNAEALRPSNRAKKNQHPKLNRSDGNNDSRCRRLLMFARRQRDECAGCLIGSMQNPSLDA